MDNLEKNLDFFNSTSVKRVINILTKKLNNIVSPSGIINRSVIPIGTLLSDQTLDAGDWISGFTVDTTTGIFTKVGHGFVVNSVIELNPNGGILPTGFLPYNSGGEFIGKCYKIGSITTDTFVLIDVVTGTTVIPTTIGSGNWQLRLGKLNLSFAITPLKIGEERKMVVDCFFAKGGTANPTFRFTVNNNSGNIYTTNGKTSNMSTAATSVTGFNSFYNAIINIKRLDNTSYEIILYNNGYSNSNDGNSYTDIYSSKYPVSGKIVNLTDEILSLDLNIPNNYLRQGRLRVYQQ